MERLLCSDINDCEYIKLLIDKGCRVNQPCIETLISRPYVDLETFRLFLNNGSTATDELMNTYCSESWAVRENHVKIMIQHIDCMLSENIEFTINHLNMILCTVTSLTKHLYLALLKKYSNILPNIHTLKIVCDGANYEIYEIITKKYKIIPNYSCLESIANRINNYWYDRDSSDKILQDILDYKIPVDEKIFNMMNNIKHAELFIAHGLTVTPAMVYHALKKGYWINDLSRFGILYDETLYYQCYIHDMLHKVSKEYMDGFKHYIGKNKPQLRSMCRNNKITIDKIFKFMLENDVRLDGYCVENACFNHKKLAKILIDDFGCEPTIRSLYGLGSAGNDNNLYLDVLRQLVDKYETLDTMTKEYDMINHEFIKLNYKS
jgi:hypothetical protein